MSNQNLDDRLEETIKKKNSVLQRDLGSLCWGHVTSSVFLVQLQYSPACKKGEREKQKRKKKLFKPLARCFYLDLKFWHCLLEVLFMTFVHMKCLVPVPCRVSSKDHD